MREDIINKKYLHKKDYVAFGASIFSWGALSGMTQAYLFIFYIQVLRIDPIVASTMFLLAKILDGFTDPVMGILIDRVRTRWGKLRPFPLFGSIPIALIFLALFTPVTNLSMSGKILYMYVTYFSFGIVSTIVCMPMMGFANVISPNTQERTRIIAIGSIASSIGEQTSLVLYSVFVFFTIMSTSLFASAIIIAIITPIAMTYNAYIFKERIKPSAKKPSIKEGLQYIYKNQPFLVLVLSNLLSFFRNLVSASIIFVVTYVFYQPSLMIAFALPGAIAAMIGMVITPYLKTKMESKQIFIFATIWHSIGLTIVFLIGPSYGWIATACLMFIAMLPVGILNVMPAQMTADTLDYWEHKTGGERREGVSGAFMGFRSKISSGLKDYVLGFLIVWAGFKSVTDRGLIPGETEVYLQAAITESRLFMIYTIIPAVTNLVSIIPLFWYKLTGDNLKKIQIDLALRRNMQNEDLEKCQESLNDYKITLSRNIQAAGTVTGAGKWQVGTELTITATTNSGYTWLGWYDGETKVSKGISLFYTFTMPASNKTYEARWKANVDTDNDNANGEIDTTIDDSITSDEKHPSSDQIGVV